MSDYHHLYTFLNVTHREKDILSALEAGEVYESEGLRVRLDSTTFSKPMYVARLIPVDGTKPVCSDACVTDTLTSAISFLECRIFSKVRGEKEYVVEGKPNAGGFSVSKLTSYKPLELVTEEEL